MSTRRRPRDTKTVTSNAEETRTFIEPDTTDYVNELDDLPNRASPNMSKRPNTPKGFKKKTPEKDFESVQNFIDEMDENPIDEIFKKEYAARFYPPSKTNGPIRVGIDVTGDGFFDTMVDLPMSKQRKIERT